jgi:hypothetical protein
MIRLSGFADEAAGGIDGPIEATRSTRRWRAS